MYTVGGKTKNVILICSLIFDCNLVESIVSVCGRLFTHTFRIISHMETAYPSIAVSLEGLLSKHVPPAEKYINL